MYAIVQVGSEQYKVSEGDVIPVDYMEKNIGDKIVLEQVLMVSDEKDVKVGQPIIKGAKVNAEVLEQGLGEKVVAFKYRRRKASATKHGHREKLTALMIKKISA